MGFGFGGFLGVSFLSNCPSLFPLVSGVALVNTAFSLTPKYKEVFESLLELYSMEDKTTEENTFLFYNKAISSSQNSREDL